MLFNFNKENEIKIFITNKKHSFSEKKKTKKKGSMYYEITKR